MLTLDPTTLAEAKRELLGKLDAAATAGHSSGAYVYVWRAREYIEKVAADVFVEFDYPSRVHSPLRVLASVDVEREDWVDRHDNGEALERISGAIRKLMTMVDENFETLFTEHLEMLNSVPREYILATVEA